jgi:hypothetical protein
MAISNPGGNLNSVAAPQKQTLSSNYIDFTSDATKGWAQQYLPDLLEKEAEVFGNRTISGFLSQVGAEESMTSDQVIWSEQGRLHLHYKAVISGDTIDMTNATDVDGNGSAEGFVAANHGIRKNDLIIISSATVTKKAIVSASVAATVTPLCFDGSDISDTFGTDAVSVLVYGSEFEKGKAGQTTANEPVFKTFTNKPIILKDYYEISGSDVSQIGWVEVSGEEGQNGYYWYVKAESDTRARFADHLEMAMLESEKGGSTNTIDDGFFSGTDGDPVGTEGLFAAIEDRGNIATGITGINAATDLFEFDSILAEFDRQGAIEENMMFVNRDVSLAMDDMLASMNSYGAGGTSYGVFNNSEDMALNLGFSGFRRGSYDFYKSDFKYLNDKGTRGGLIDEVNAIRGVIVPAGVSSVYDQQLGRNLKRPFLHVRYRASQMEDRKMKTWVTGSVGGQFTTDIDAMKMHYLSERCLVVQGANNFMLLK